MAITSAIANTFKSDILAGAHTAANSYKMALYTNAATINSGNTAYTATNEVAASGGYSTTGASAGTYTPSLNGTVGILTFNNVTWANATFTARGCMIYNDTLAGKNMVACFDFGNDIVGGGGNFTVNMPTANNTLALVRIA